MLRFLVGFFVMFGGAGTVDLGGDLLVGFSMMVTGLLLMNWGVKNLGSRV